MGFLIEAALLSAISGALLRLNYKQRDAITGSLIWLLVSLVLTLIIGTSVAVSTWFSSKIDLGSFFLVKVVPWWQLLLVSLGTYQGFSG